MTYLAHPAHYTPGEFRTMVRGLKFAKGWWNYFRLNQENRDLQSVGGWVRRHMRK